ncbi:MAG: hypothetical protein WA688_03805 [Thermoplasmata archaeon]
MGESAGATTTEWASIWERAATATAGHPPYDKVYTGPIWESGHPSGAFEARVWKIAVLERRPTAGAEHWGHLFVLLREKASEVAIRPEGGVQGYPDRPALEILPEPSGAPLQIWIWPRSAETAVRLRAFALEFQRHAVALVAP